MTCRLQPLFGLLLFEMSILSPRTRVPYIQLVLVVSDGVFSIGILYTCCISVMECFKYAFNILVVSDGLFQTSLYVFEIFKCPYERIPCVESGYTAI